MICPKSKLNLELDKLRMIVLENGYSDDVIATYIKEGNASLVAEVKFGLQMFAFFKFILKPGTTKKSNCFQKSCFRQSFYFL